MSHPKAQTVFVPCAFDPTHPHVEHRLSYVLANRTGTFFCPGGCQEAYYAAQHVDQTCANPNHDTVNPERPRTWNKLKSDPSVYCSHVCRADAHRIVKVQLPCWFPGCSNLVGQYPSAVPASGVSSCSQHPRKSGGGGNKGRKGTTEACANPSCPTPDKLIYRGPSYTNPVRYHKGCVGPASSQKIQKKCTVCEKPFEVPPCHAAKKTCKTLRCQRIVRIKRPRWDRPLHNDMPLAQDHLGYLKIWEPDHPRANGGWTYEHILVAEAMLGRYLRPGEEVHHENRIKDDNSPGNLVVTDSLTHKRITAQDNWSDLRRYREAFGPLESDKHGEEA